MLGAVSTKQSPPFFATVLFSAFSKSGDKQMRTNLNFPNPGKLQSRPADATRQERSTIQFEICFGVKVTLVVEMATGEGVNCDELLQTESAGGIARSALAVETVGANSRRG